MNQHEHLGVVDAAECHAEKIAYAVKFDSAHAAVCAGVVRIEADGQRKRVEPQCAARPGGIDPAFCCLTPHGFISPPGLCSRSIRESLPQPRPDGLKKAG